MMNAIIIPKFNETGSVHDMDAVIRALSSTMGPFGRVVEFESSNGFGEIRLRKGAKIARELIARGLGGRLFQSLVELLDGRFENTEDGSTATLILAISMFLDAKSQISYDLNLDELAVEIKDAVRDAKKELLNFVLSDVDDRVIEQVARTATLNRPLGNLVAKAISMSRGNSLAVVVDGDNEKESVEFRNGLIVGTHIECAHLSNLEDTHDDHLSRRGYFEIKGAAIITRESVSSPDSLTEDMRSLAYLGRPILIITGECAPIPNSLISTWKETSLDFCIVTARSSPYTRKKILDDVAILTGERREGDDNDSERSAREPGHAERIIVRGPSCLIIGGGGSRSRIAEQIGKSKYAHKDIFYYLGQYVFSGIQENVAVISVPESSSTEGLELHQEFCDTVRSVGMAVRSGVVSGGGVALFRASNALILTAKEGNKGIGKRIVSRAMKLPLAAIVSNRDDSQESVFGIILSSEPSVGYDAVTGQFGDIIDVGVFDAYSAVCNTLDIAAEAVSLLLRNEKEEGDSFKDEDISTFSVSSSIDRNHLPARFVRPTPDTYRVWFATDRRQVDPLDSLGDYLDEPDNCLHFGSCVVQIPQSHPSQAGRSWIYKVFNKSSRNSPELVSVETEDKGSFIGDISDCMHLLPEARKAVLMVIHGYRVSFKAAVIHAAQMAMDLKLDGPTVVYSWPSTAEVTGYMADEATIERTTTKFCDFLKILLDISDVDSVNVVAHSMGNRLLMSGAKYLARQATIRRLGQVVLAAPDIDGSTFEESIADYEKARQDSARTTLYWNSGDKALKTSSILHRAKRTGLRGSFSFREGADSIRWCGDSKWSLLDLGHSYHASASPVIDDIREVLLRRTHPSQRKLTPRPGDRPIHWDLVVNETKSK